MKSWFRRRGWKFGVTIVQVAVLAAVFTPLLIGIEKAQLTSKRASAERTAANTGHVAVAPVRAQ
jgi:hypothetical protein